jgi:hypothetical protein
MYIDPYGIRPQASIGAVLEFDQMLRLRTAVATSGLLTVGLLIARQPSPDPSPAAARTRVVVLDVATGQYGSVDIQAR